MTIAQVQLPKNVACTMDERHARPSLLHRRFYCRHAMLLPWWGGELRDNTKNGCEADYARPKHFNNLSPKRDQYD